MRRLYIGAITLITIICVIVGTSIHFGGFHFGNFTFNIGSKWDEKWSEKINKEMVKEENIPLDAFDEIQVDVDVMGLTVKPGTEYSFSYYCTDNLIPQYEVKDGILYITQSQKIKYGTNNCDATLTLPADVLLEKVYITSDVGGVDLDRLAITDLSVYCDVGDVNIDDTKMDYAKLEVSVGDVNIKRSELGELDVYSDVGDVDIQSAKDISEYSFDLTADIGDIDLDGREYKDECYIRGNETLVKVTSDIGDIEISW